MICLKHSYIVYIIYAEAERVVYSLYCHHLHMTPNITKTRTFFRLG